VLQRAIGVAEAAQLTIMPVHVGADDVDDRDPPRPGLFSEETA
jgi:hypothetical protein